MSKIPDLEVKSQDLKAKRENRLYVVYAIRCTANGRVYVGCTSDIRSRIRSHFQQLRRKYKRSAANHSGGAMWQNDYDQYGESAFEYYILQENVPYADKSDVEAYWINKLHAKESEHGYNVANPRLMPMPIPLVAGIPPIEDTTDAVH